VPPDATDPSAASPQGRTASRAAAPRPRPAHYAHTLSDHVRHAIGETAFGLDGRLRHWQDALLPGIGSHLRRRIPELVDPQRLRQPERAPAFVVNSFIPWLERAGSLILDDRHGFDELCFGARCPTGIRGTPPQLDLLAIDGHRLVAVTAAAADYLLRRPPSLAAAYAGASFGADMAGWQALLDQLRAGGPPFRHLDAAGIVKLAVGLDRSFPQHDVSLLYLFWEPVGGERLAPFARHREEIDRVLAFTSGDRVGFAASTFADLWGRWLEPPAHPAVPALVRALRQRYGVTMDNSALV